MIIIGLLFFGLALLIIDLGFSTVEEDTKGKAVKVIANAIQEMKGELDGREYVLMYASLPNERATVNQLYLLSSSNR